MFMRRNRATNGAPQPEAVARDAASAQREQLTLMPNVGGLGTPQHRTFQPNLDTPEGINRLHREASTSGTEGESGNYTQHIPVGPRG